MKINRGIPPLGCKPVVKVRAETKALVRTKNRGETKTRAKMEPYRRENPKEEAKQAGDQQHIKRMPKARYDEDPKQIRPEGEYARGRDHRRRAKERRPAKRSKRAERGPSKFPSQK